jgi:hypothetical protein
MIYHQFSKDYYLENIACGNGYTIIVEAPLKKRRSIKTDDLFEINITNDENMDKNKKLI